jgi:dolichol-phosphate mannosyltransferase
MGEPQHTAARTPELCLVIPTFNERAGIGLLVHELDRSLPGLAWQALFVDDSTDGTDDVIRRLAAQDARLHVLHRDRNRGGLAGAVVEGLRLATGTYVCVLDADLQHPPANIPCMLREALGTGADLVIASRYIPGGSTGGLDGPLRQLYSRAFKHLSRAVFPHRLAGVTDPLGGFFIVRRTVLQGADLRPVGYKILLEILIRCRWHIVREVPYAFGERRSGESKADFRQGLWFLEHLLLLIWQCSPALWLPRAMLGGPTHKTKSAAAASRT